MKISAVVAIAQNNAIGRGGDLMWRLPNDMQRFKEITMGHHVLMGRKTYESIPPKFRPLPGRANIIVSRQPGYIAEGCKVVATVEEGIRFAADNGEDELMVIGGGEIYKQVFELTDCIYLTKVQQPFYDADAFYPEIKESDWHVRSLEHHPVDAKHAYAYDYVLLERKAEKGLSYPDIE